MIVLQLEKLETLRQFLSCFAYELISYQSLDDGGGQTREYYELTWEPTNERDSGEIWLTRPAADQEPSILEALTTFSYVGKDVGHGADYTKLINYEAVTRSLEASQREDMAMRRQNQTIGESDPAIKGWLESQMPQENDAIWLWAARHDRLATLEKKWTAFLPELAGMLRNGADMQADYDLMSVFVLLLRDELKRLQRRIVNRPTEVGSAQPADVERPKRKGTSPWQR
jgi:hypothetical protein